MSVAQMVVLRFTPKQIRSGSAEVIETIRGTLEGARGRPPLNLRTVPALEVGQPGPACEVGHPARPMETAS